MTLWQWLKTTWLMETGQVASVFHKSLESTETNMREYLPHACPDERMELLSIIRESRNIRLLNFQKPEDATAIVPRMTELLERTKACHEEYHGSDSQS